MAKNRGIRSSAMHPKTSAPKKERKTASAAGRRKPVAVKTTTTSPEGIERLRSR